MSTHTLQEKLDELCEDCMTMTDWEVNFIDDCAKKADNGESFSLKQKQGIEAIYEERILR